jgi:hypothetical protein
MFKEFIYSVREIMPKEVCGGEGFKKVPVVTELKTRESMIYDLNRLKKENLHLPTITLNFNKLKHKEALVNMDIFSQYYEHYLEICEDLFSKNEINVKIETGETISIVLEEITQEKNLIGDNLQKHVVHGKGIYSVRCI